MSQEQQFQSTAILLHVTIRMIDMVIRDLESPVEPILPIRDVDLIVAELRIVRQMVEDEYNRQIELRYPRYPRFPAEK